MTTSSSSHFTVDRKLRLNIGFAIALIILCPLALWYFYFRHDNLGPKDKQSYTELVKNYCSAYSLPDFHAATVFAPEVKNYLQHDSVTPVDIDHIVAMERQRYMYPHLIPAPDASMDSIMPFDETGGGATIWLREVTYVKSKMNYRSRDIRYGFYFDKEGKITGLDSINMRNETFTRDLPK